MNPSVTVIILSYNQSEYLLDAVESVINQTTDDWELIVIDNGSTDGSQELLSKYKSNLKIRLIFHAENRNITLNCNQGVNLANGKYISFLFADDYFLPDKFKKELECFSSLPDDYGFIHSPSYGYNVVTKKKTLLPCIPASGYVLKDLLTRYEEGYINPITPLIKKECFEKYKFYEEIFTEGESIFFRIAMKYKFFYMKEPTAVMREHGKNMRFAKKKNAITFEYTMNKLAIHEDFPIQFIGYLRKLNARIFSSFAWQDIRLGTDAKWARLMYKKSIREDWRQIYRAKTIIGWGMSWLPVKGRVIINKTIDGILNRENIIYMDEYYK